MHLLFLHPPSTHWGISYLGSSLVLRLVVSVQCISNCANAADRNWLRRWWAADLILAGRTDSHTHKSLYRISGWSRWTWGRKMSFNLCDTRDLSMIVLKYVSGKWIKWNRHFSYWILDSFVPWNHSSNTPGLPRRRQLVRLQNIKRHSRTLVEAVLLCAVCSHVIRSGATLLPVMCCRMCPLSQQR